MNKPIVNVTASVRDRLLNLARERKEDFGLLLTKYGLERILYRISQSTYRNGVEDVDEMGARGLDGVSGFLPVDMRGNRHTQPDQRFRS